LGKLRNFRFCPKPWALWRIPDRYFPGYLRKKIMQILRILFCLKIIGQIIYVEEKFTSSKKFGNLKNPNA
jgi:hypothetical protein